MAYRFAWCERDSGEHGQIDEAREELTRPELCAGSRIELAGSRTIMVFGRYDDGRVIHRKLLRHCMLRVEEYGRDMGVQQRRHCGTLCDGPGDPRRTLTLRPVGDRARGRVVARLIVSCDQERKPETHDDREHCDVDENVAHSSHEISALARRSRTLRGRNVHAAVFKISREQGIEGDIHTRYNSCVIALAGAMRWRSQREFGSRMSGPGTRRQPKRLIGRTLAIVAMYSLAFTVQTSANADVTTNNHDAARTGWYPDQSGLSPAVVSASFGQEFSAAVDGQVYAQPVLADGTLVVATQNNNVYGLDPNTGAQKWVRSLGTPWNTADIGCGDVNPHVGVMATPTIDPATHTAYLTNKTYVSGTSGNAMWLMHAIDVGTGVERSGFPVTIRGFAQNAPTKAFVPTTQLQRPGLLAMNGVVYAAFGSACDMSPWRGWIAGVSTGGALKALWTTVTDDTDGAGIWQSGSGIASDGAGRMFVSTGNGGFALTGPTAGSNPPGDLGMAVVRLSVNGDGTLTAKDFFSPAAATARGDLDLGSGGPVVLPDTSFGTTTIPHLMFEQGKDGYAYLLNRDKLGGYRKGPGGSDAVVSRAGPFGGVWGKAGVWPGNGGYLYVVTATATAGAAVGGDGNLRVYKYGLDGLGKPKLTLAGTSSDRYGFGSGSPVVTSNGTTSGSALVWTTWEPNGSGTNAQLRAYDPVPVNGRPVLRWSAPIGIANKFSVPTFDANRVYVGTRDGHVLAFGPKPTTNVFYPSTGASVHQTTTIAASASSPFGIGKVEIRATGGALNDTVVGTAPQTAFGWILNWDTTHVADGEYSVRSVAYDMAGKSATSTTISVIIDNTPPNTTIAYPSDGATLTGNSILDASASDNVGVTGVEYHATDAASNDHALGAATLTRYGWVLAWHTNTVSNGTYTITAIARDAAGNTTTSPPTSVVVKN